MSNPGCVELSDKLSSCIPYSCYFHVKNSSNDSMQIEKKVIGANSEKCEYTIIVSDLSDSRNSGGLKCNFNIDEKNLLVQFYKKNTFTNETGLTDLGEIMKSFIDDEVCVESNSKI